MAASKSERLLEKWGMAFSEIFFGDAAKICSADGLLNGSDKQGLQRRIADNPAAMAVQAAVKVCAFRQQIVGEEMIARPEDTRGSIAQADFHFAAQDHQPLCGRRAMEVAADAGRTVPYLKTARRKQLGQQGLGRTVRQSEVFFAKFGVTVDVGVQNDVLESGHGIVGSRERGIVNKTKGREWPPLRNRVMWNSEPAAEKDVRLPPANLIENGIRN